MVLFSHLAWKTEFFIHVRQVRNILFFGRKKSTKTCQRMIIKVRWSKFTNVLYPISKKSNCRFYGTMNPFPESYDETQKWCNWDGKRWTDQKTGDEKHQRHWCIMIIDTLGECNLDRYTFSIALKGSHPTQIGCRKPRGHPRVIFKRFSFRHWFYYFFFLTSYPESMLKLV